MEEKRTENKLEKRVKKVREKPNQQKERQVSTIDYNSNYLQMYVPDIVHHVQAMRNILLFYEKCTMRIKQNHNIRIKYNIIASDA
mmetsp:Transcript_20532/g.32689  ORF Transcript_20532/g.32689 Transcript_20532/m.32689 type:complete len:85 (+) Transcript_20532:78-332(+)